MADTFQGTGHTVSTKQRPCLHRADILATFIEQTLEYEQTPEVSILNSFTNLPGGQDNIFDLLKALQKN